MTTDQLEARVQALEREVAELKTRVVTAPTADWRRTIGAFRGDAAFREIAEAGKAIREAEPACE